MAELKSSQKSNRFLLKDKRIICSKSDARFFGCSVRKLIEDRWPYTSKLKIPDYGGGSALFAHYLLYWAFKLAKPERWPCELLIECSHFNGVEGKQIFDTINLEQFPIQLDSSNSWIDLWATPRSCLGPLFCIFAEHKNKVKKLTIYSGAMKHLYTITDSTNLTQLFPFLEEVYLERWAFLIPRNGGRIAIASTRWKSVKLYPEQWLYSLSLFNVCFDHTEVNKCDLLSLCSILTENAHCLAKLEIGGLAATKRSFNEATLAFNVLRALTNCWFL